jgi:hypothetical protein
MNCLNVTVLFMIEWSLFSIFILTFHSHFLLYVRFLVFAFLSVDAQTHLDTRESYATLAFSIMKKSRENDVIASKKQVLDSYKKQRNHNIRTVNVWHHDALTRLRKHTAAYRELENWERAYDALCPETRTNHSHSKKTLSFNSFEKAVLIQVSRNSRFHSTQYKKASPFNPYEKPPAQLSKRISLWFPKYTSFSTT